MVVDPIQVGRLALEQLAADDEATVKPAFPFPDERGNFAEADCEEIYSPGSVGKLLVIQQLYGWHAGAALTLPEATLFRAPSQDGDAFSARDGAISAAAEILIGWTSEEKARGKKKHRAEAEALQAWCFEMRAKHPAEAGVPLRKDDDFLERLDPDAEEQAAAQGTKASSDGTARVNSGPDTNLAAAPFHLPRGSKRASKPAADERAGIAPAGEGPDPQPQSLAFPGEGSAAGTSSFPGVPQDAVAKNLASVHAYNPDAAIQMVPIGMIRESEWNPRQIYPEAAMAELTASMRQNGFRPWLPLVVRPVGPSSQHSAVSTQEPAAQGEVLYYELAAGHRRRRAAEAAGIQEVPCLVRAASDEEFEDVLNFDNSGREDVHPLHEAAGWRVWMDRWGHGVKDIAARIGQSIEYVYVRLKCADLIPEAAQAFLDGKFKLATAVQIARLPESEQKKALKFALGADWQGTLPSAKALAQHLERSAYQDLEDAAFEPEDGGLLAGAGACSTCLKRAANIPGFEFQEAEPGEPLPDLCTDAVCFRQKTDNHLVRIRERVRAKTGQEPLRISTSWQKAPKGVLKSDQWKEVKKDDKGAQPAVVEGDGYNGKTGEVKWVKPVERRTSGGCAQPSAAEQEAQRKKDEEIRQRELKLRKAVLTAVREKVPDSLAVKDLLPLIAYALRVVRGESGRLLCELHGISCKAQWDTWKPLEKALASMKQAEVCKLLVEIPVIDELEGYMLDRKAEGLLEAARRFKVDVTAVTASLEGGTRREVGKKQSAVSSQRSAKAGKKSSAKKTAKKAAAKKAPKKGGRK